MLIAGARVLAWRAWNQRMGWPVLMEERLCLAGEEALQLWNRRHSSARRARPLQQCSPIVLDVEQRLARADVLFGLTLNGVFSGF